MTEIFRNIPIPASASNASRDLRDTMAIMEIGDCIKPVIGTGNAHNIVKAFTEASGKKFLVKAINRQTHVWRLS